MCKGNLPQLELTTTQLNHMYSTTKCSFRPKTSKAVRPSQLNDLHGMEHHLPSLTQRDFTSKDIMCLDGTHRKSDLVDGKKSISAVRDKHKIRRSKSVCRDKCEEPALGTELISLNLNVSSPSQKKKEIVVFLPDEREDKEFVCPGQSVKQCSLIGNLPDINSNHLKEPNSNKVQSTDSPKIEEITVKWTQSRCRALSHPPQILPPIGNQDKRGLRRVKSHDLENHLKQADKYYDESEAKSTMMCKWFMTQNDCKNLDCY